MKKVEKMMNQIKEEIATHMDKNLSTLNTKELAEAADTLKDLSETLYYMKLIDAMDKAEYGVDYDEHGPLHEPMPGMPLKH